jgi:uncharacterized protein (DUF2147 family)
MRLKITLAATLIASATAVQAADVHGIWRSETADDGGFIHVEIAPCAGNAALKCGTIIDAQNVDPAKADPARRAELVGKVMIKDMAADSATEWSDGTIWAPDDDETYASTLELKGDVLIVSGCVLGGLICRGQDWTRVK